MIQREGIVPLAASAAIAALASGVAGWLYALPLWLVTLWLARVYWEHRPPVPAEPRGVLSPVTGRVLAVGVETDPWLERPALRVSIGVGFPGVIPLRSPTEGRVMDLYARRGVFGAAQRACTVDQSPDCYGQWVRTDEGEDVLYAVSSHWPVSRARFDHAPGERTGQGARSGFFYGASVADVMVPEDADPGVVPGDVVDAGETVLARLRRA